MGEYEPNDSRNVTLNPSSLPGEPPRTGPREAESRAASQGEKGRRAAPTPGEDPLQTAADRGAPPQATQSQWQGGQSQSQGGLSQSSGGEASIGGGSGQFGSDDPRHAAPAQQDGAALSADFPVSQAEAASGHSSAQPMAMQPADTGAESAQREQAAGQGPQDAPQGFGYGAEDGEEMGDAPDSSDGSGRGYGDAGEERLRKLQRDG